MTICSDVTLKDRLFKKIVIGVAENDCWDWMGATYKFGYGCIGTSTGLDGAHRVSYKLLVGDIPEGMCVLHTCDNPKCNNPKHLFLGSKKDNAIDRNSKGRGKNPIYRGEDHPKATLTWANVAVIRSGKYRPSELVKMFNVGTNQVSRIINFKRWIPLEGQV